MRKILVMGMMVVCALSVGLAGAQNDLSFVDAQICVVDSSTSESYYVLTYNYAQNTLAWAGELTTGTQVPYTLPANEWVGLFIYNMSSAGYSSAEYTYRYAGVAAARSGAVSPTATLAASPSSTLCFSPSSSLVVADVTTPNGWLFWFNYGTSAQAWTALSQDTIPVAITAPLGEAQQWIGMFLYNQGTGDWEEETFYTMWDAFDPVVPPNP